MPALLITLEGGEGSGKSTVAGKLAEQLRNERHTVTLTEEPAGTELGRHIWEFFHDPARPMVDPLAELLFFEAARAQHVAEVIRPALARGEIVICDRFGDSSIAYQGYGRELGLELVERLNEIATGGLSPDLTLVLDLPVETGLARARARSGNGDDVIGSQASVFHERVRTGFLEIARRNPRRVVVIDAAGALAAVLDDAMSAVGRLLG